MKVGFRSYHRAWLALHSNRDEAWLREKLREGFDVHHLDGDKANEAPENLVLIEHLDHMRLHGSTMTIGRLAVIVTKKKIKRARLKDIEKETIKEYQVVTKKKIKRARLKDIEKETIKEYQVRISREHLAEQHEELFDTYHDYIVGAVKRRQRYFLSLKEWTQCRELKAQRQALHAQDPQHQKKQRVTAFPT